MERLDQREGNPVPIAGASPSRGYIVAGAALIIGLFLMFTAFDGGDERVLASDETKLVTTAAAALPQTNIADPTPEVESSSAQEIDGDGASTSAASEDISPPTAVESEPFGVVSDAARAPQDVSVMVVNSRAGKGAAARLSERLSQQGYDNVPPANASQLAPSAIYYVEGFAAEANELAEFLGVGSEIALAYDPASVPVDDRRSADIIVVVTSAGPITA